MEARARGGQPPEVPRPVAVGRQLLLRAQVQVPDGNDEPSVFQSAAGSVACLGWWMGA